MGVVLMILGAVYHLATALTPEPENLKQSRITVASLVVGGHGFLLAFYLAGAGAVPRRFASYPAEVAQGPLFANVALVFIAVLFGGLILYLLDAGPRCVRALKAG
jgi:heme/copper-type cytochrome/quinol oxidase subunit 1